MLKFSSVTRGSKKNGLIVVPAGNKYGFMILSRKSETPPGNK